MNYVNQAPKCVVAALMVIAMGCGGPAADSADKGFRAIDADSATFWDRQTTVTADLLGQMVAEFNADREGPPLRVVQSGRYGDIHQKVLASIRARVLPAMAVAYPNMVAAYAQSNAVVALDDFIADPDIGLSEAELDDYFPAVLDTNRFEDHGDRLLSFPYTKSVLVLFYNNNVLRAAGLDGPPATWDDFLAQCRQIKNRTGKTAISLDVDASTVAAMIYSMGGDVLEGRVTQFDTPEAIAVFELIDTLMQDELAIQNPPRTFNDEVAFVDDEIAFIMRTSATQPTLAQAKPNLAEWGIARIPQADPDRPATVLYGANVCIFRTTENHSRAAWEFVRFFTSTENCVRWALGTGYLPIRKSAALHPDMKAHFKSWPSNRTAFDCLEFARSEPNLAAWQEVRSLIENAQTAVLTGMMNGREAALDLKRQADALLAARIQ